MQSNKLLEVGPSGGHAVETQICGMHKQLMLKEVCVLSRERLCCLMRSNQHMVS